MPVTTPQIVMVAGTPTAVVAESTTWDAFPELWGDLLGEVWAFLRGSGLEPGRNIMLYLDDQPRVEVGAEVSGSFAPAGRVVPSTLPAGRAAMVVVCGAPSPANLALAQAAVREWCADQGHSLSGRRREIYGHWRDDQDPARYETEVYWLLEPG